MERSTEAVLTFPLCHPLLLTLCVRLISLPGWDRSNFIDSLIVRLDGHRQIKHMSQIPSLLELQ